MCWTNSDWTFVVGANVVRPKFVRKKVVRTKVVRTKVAGLFQRITKKYKKNCNCSSLVQKLVKLMDKKILGKVPLNQKNFFVSLKQPILNFFGTIYTLS